MTFFSELTSFATYGMTQKERAAWDADAPKRKAEAEAAATEAAYRAEKHAAGIVHIQAIRQQSGN